MSEKQIFPDAPQRVYTVSELTLAIKELLEASFPRVWVEAEVSNLHRHSSGHMYLTLKDQRSQIRAVMFRSQARELGFEPEDGMRLLCLGRIGLYEVRGEYQLYVDFMEPRGLGALQKAFEQLKGRLQKEGLFDPSRKRPLPVLPACIGIVTSPTGAVIRDMLQILGRRFPNLHILVRPVRVQGQGAAQDIVQGLEDLNRHGGVDLIVIARGGGSLEDLWAFNEEAVARAIASSAVPVVSAVGHEVDYTIADFVADLRAPTPSAAAELIVPVKRELLAAISELKDDLAVAMARCIRDQRDALDACRQRLGDRRRRLADWSLLIDDLHGRLGASAWQGLTRARERLRHQSALLLRADPRQRIHGTRVELRSLEARLGEAVAKTLLVKRGELAREGAMLESLSPLKVLGRGYSIVRSLPGHEIVRDATLLQPGDRLRVTFQRGEADCRVEPPDRSGRPRGQARGR
jgi:exodeoxyribonuclease VII large subunit